MLRPVNECGKINDFTNWIERSFWPQLSSRHSFTKALTRMDIDSFFCQLMLFDPPNINFWLIMNKRYCNPLEHNTNWDYCYICIRSALYLRRSLELHSELWLWLQSQKLGVLITHSIAFVEEILFNKRHAIPIKKVFSLFKNTTDATIETPIHTT